jgi:hypothetical protein
MNQWRQNKFSPPPAVEQKEKQNRLTTIPVQADDGKSFLKVSLIQSNSSFNCSNFC